MIATAALAGPFGLVALAAVALAALGLCIVASARPIARAAAWLLLLLFVVVALWQPRVENGEAPARRGNAMLTDDPARARTDLLVAAAGSDPSAEHLLVTAPAPLAAAVGDGVLGARAVQPPALPLQPDELQVQALGPIVAGRPLALQVVAPAVAGAPLAAELRVRAGDVEVLRAPVALGTSVPPPVSFLVPDAAALTIELVVPLAEATISVRGGAAIAPAPSVLVLEPSGIAAAALQAQGVRVVAATAPPAEWRDVAAVVLGQPLPAGAQQELVAAVLDGVGLFALAPAFGAADEPLRAILPVRPAPTQPAIADGPGSERTPAATPANEPPPGETPPPKPPTNEPPAGDTQGAQLAKDPIEVDKRSIALVLVVDRSGSMGTVLANGRTKMSYAKSSALRTAEALGDGDQVAIVTYGNKEQGRIELPMTAATADEAVRLGVEKLEHASEFTFLLGGLQVAEELLRGTTAAVKHVVVITDGEFDTGEDLGLKKLARDMRRDLKASVSVIAITDAFTGAVFKKLSEELTQYGGGQFLPTDDPTTVPVFVVAEVTRALQRVGRKPRNGDGSATAGAGNVPPTNPPPNPPPPKPPQPERPQPEAPSPRRLAVRAVAESPLLLPAPAAAWPMLGGALAGTAPLDAQVLLVAGDDGWPLLAYGNRGLGRVGAFAADLCGNDGGEFRGDVLFPGRLAAWVQSVLPALPSGAPQALQREVQVTPERPTPRDRARLAQIAGSEPEVAAPAVVPPRATRLLVGVAPDFAPWLVAGLVLLAALERWSAWRALRRSAG